MNLKFKRFRVEVRGRGSNPFRDCLTLVKESSSVSNVSEILRSWDEMMPHHVCWWWWWCWGRFLEFSGSLKRRGSGFAISFSWVWYCGYGCSVKVSIDGTKFPMWNLRRSIVMVIWSISRHTLHTGSNVCPHIPTIVALCVSVTNELKTPRCWIRGKIQQRGVVRGTTGAGASPWFYGME